MSSVFPKAKPTNKQFNKVLFVAGFESGMSWGLEDPDFHPRSNETRGIMVLQLWQRGRALGQDQFLFKRTTSWPEVERAILTMASKAAERNLPTMPLNVLLADVTAWYNNPQITFEQMGAITDHPAYRPVPVEDDPKTNGRGARGG